MLKRTKWPRAGTILAIALPIGLVSGLALAVNPDTTTLPNGAELSVQIVHPSDNEENKVPANDDGSAGGTTSVAIDGSASVGEGVPNIHITFTLDVSGSTDFFECAGGVILDCEQDAVVEVLNDPNIASVLDVGIAVFADNGASADMSPAGGDQPLTSTFADAITVANSTFSDQGGGDGGVAQFTNKPVGQFTNYTAGLLAANSSVSASAALTKRMFFLSDGLPNPAGSLAAFDAAVTALGVRIDSFALGDPATVTCGVSTEVSLQRMADLSGGNCQELEDPADIITTLPNLIATSLDSVQVAVDGGDIPTTANVPQAGPVNVPYDATANLGVGTYVISATADGSDNAGSDTVTADVTKHVLQLIANPFTETNELSEDNEHTVFGQILGGSGLDRNIDFAVGGTNAATATPGGGSILATPGGAAVQFDYTVQGNECASLGIDTITVSTTIAGMLDSIDLSKDWVDTIPPEATCVETVNPHGNNIPKAPGNGGQGQNQDGFYELGATDNLSGESCAPLQIFVTDAGSGTVFGPFAVGDKIKYTQDPDAVPESKKMGSGKGQAGAIAAHIIGNGDASVTAVDQSGNTSAAVSCLVPPPPK